MSSQLSQIRQALYRQQPEIARTLLEAGAQPDFYDACALGDWDTAERFLSSDPSLAASFAEDGFPALGLAIYFGKRDLAIHLLARGRPRMSLRATPCGSHRCTRPQLKATSFCARFCCRTEPIRTRRSPSAERRCIRRQVSAPWIR